MLHASQEAALAYVTNQARSRKEAALATLEEVRRMSNLPAAALERGIRNIKEHARITLAFHPDRLGPDFATVADGLLSSGLYKSQFETLLSSGSVSAVPGGARDVWERRLYGGAYHAGDVTNAHRPKYGALDLMRHADGASPRFGSCYFLLRPQVSLRATFTYLDSHQEPPEKGTYEEFDDIVAALFAEAFTRDFAIGEPNLTPARLLERLNGLDAPYGDPSGRAPRRNLNHYIEAQVHGDVRLLEDVEMLVIDPSFRDTDVGRTLLELCDRYDVAHHFHGGFELPVTEVPDDFRGPTMPSLAARIARISGDGVVDAAAIGRAAAILRHHPADWSDRGDHAWVLQELKLMWHVLVRHGRRSSKAQSV